MTMTENASGNLPFGDVDRLADQVMDRADADQAQLLGPDGLLIQRGRPVVRQACHGLVMRRFRAVACRPTR
jgi:hypothetical protein